GEDDLLAEARAPPAVRARPLDADPAAGRERALPGALEAAPLRLVLEDRLARQVGREPGVQLGAEGLLGRGVSEPEHGLAGPARAARGRAGSRTPNSPHTARTGVRDAGARVDASGLRQECPRDREWCASRSRLGHWGDRDAVLVGAAVQAIRSLDHRRSEER